MINWTITCNHANIVSMSTKNTKRKTTKKNTAKTKKEYASPVGAIANMNEIRNKLLMNARIRVDDRINPQHDKVLKDYLTGVIEAALTMKVHTQYEQNAFIETMKGINYLIYKHDEPVSDDVYNDDDMRSIVVSFSNYMHDNMKSYAYVVNTANMNRIILGYQLCELIHEFIITKPDREENEEKTTHDDNDADSVNTEETDDSTTDASTDITHDDSMSKSEDGTNDSINVNTNSNNLNSHVNKDVFTAVMMAHALDDLKAGFDYQFAVQNAIVYKDDIIRKNLEEEAAEEALKVEQDKANGDSNDSSVNENNVVNKHENTEKLA